MERDRTNQHAALYDFCTEGFNLPLCGECQTDDDEDDDGDLAVVS